MAKPNKLAKLLTERRMSRRSLLAGALAGAAAAASGLSLDGVGRVGHAQVADFWGVSNVYFDQTGHHLRDDFLVAWQANGGLRTFGYPLTERVEEDGQEVQYFERARFEFHPEHEGTQYIVQASLLGRWITEDRRDEDPFQPEDPPEDDENDDDGDNDRSRIYFPQTGHTLAYGFKEYWEQNGGLYVFGYPISREFTERNRDTGNDHTVQYFERARFEWHPEHQGTPYEVLLGRMGAEYADAREVDTSSVPKSSDSIRAFPGLLDPDWSRAVRTLQGDALGVITATTLNVRTEPSLNAEVVGTMYDRQTVVLHGLVAGDEFGDVPAWYRLGDDRFVAAAYVAPFIAPDPPKTYSGRWVDVNLSQFYAVCYQDSIPVYGAFITAGRDGRTPIGEFQVLRRVRNETMDSATVGIPEGDPEYYYLEDVQYTQYFKSGGYALHQNYWTHPSSYGQFSSNGCVGLMLHDARFFWDFLNVGSWVHVHF